MSFPFKLYDIRYNRNRERTWGAKNRSQTSNWFHISYNINVMDLGVYSFPPSMILEIIPLMLERVDVNFLLNIKRVKTKIFSQKLLLQCDVTLKVVQ